MEVENSDMIFLTSLFKFRFLLTKSMAFNAVESSPSVLPGAKGDPVKFFLSMGLLQSPLLNTNNQTFESFILIYNGYGVCPGHLNR